MRLLCLILPILLLCACVSPQQKLSAGIRAANPQVVEDALAQKPELNRCDREGLTPLCRSVRLYKKSHLEEKRLLFIIVYQLLEAGADVNAVCGATTALHAAVASHNVLLAALLFRYGASANIRDSYGETPLWLAVQRNDTAMLRLLLSHGADPNARNLAGRTALQTLRLQGKEGKGVAKLLRAAGGH